VDSAVPLVMLGPGEEGTIVECQGGHGFVSRLAAMGFTPGSRIAVLSNYGRGPLLVRVHGSRVALGRGEAAKILVRPEVGPNA
jgi:ferrous iron transport protein A